MKYIRKIGICLALVSLAWGILCSALSASQAQAGSKATLNLGNPHLVASLLWVSQAVFSLWSFYRVRAPHPTHGTILAVLLSSGSLGIAATALPFPSAGFAAFLLSLLISPFLCGTVPFLAVNGMSTALHAALLGILENPLMIQITLIVSIPACALALVARRAFRDWEQQTQLFDQARWAASAFVKTNIRMQDNVDRIASLTQTEDRLWISRELHDSIGYTLTAALAQTVACEKVLTSGNEGTGSLLGRLQGIENMVRDTIREMRLRVSSLRGGASAADNGTRRWSRLCRAFADSTGIRVEAHMAAELSTVSEEVSDGVYRIIQESLTNAYRHGNAGLVDVALAWEEDQGRILLRVSDNGKGSADVVPGNGLNGMRERVGRLGGEFVWQSAPNRGFNIGVVIPWKGTAP